MYVYILNNYLTDFVNISNCSLRYQESSESSSNHFRFMSKCYTQYPTGEFSISVELVNKTRFVTHSDFPVNWDTLKPRYAHKKKTNLWRAGQLVILEHNIVNISS